MHAEPLHQQEHQPRQDGVNAVQHRRNKQEGELNRLGDTADDGSDRAREHNALHPRSVFRAGAAVDRQRNRRNTEHLDGRQPGHKGSGGNRHLVFQLGKEDELVAMHHLPGLVHVLAELQPERRPPDMVKTKRDQQSLDKAEQEGGHARPLHRHGIRQAINQMLNRRPDHRHHQPDKQRGEGGHYRHEALAGKKLQPRRKLNTVIAFIQPGGDNPDNDAAKHAGLERRDAQHHSVVTHLRHRLGRDPQKLADGDVHNQKPGDRRQPGNALIVTEPYRHADRKQQRQVSENRTARFRH